MSDQTWIDKTNAELAQAELPGRLLTVLASAVWYRTDRDEGMKLGLASGQLALSKVPRDLSPPATLHIEIAPAAAAELASSPPTEVALRLAQMTVAGDVQLVGDLGLADALRVAIEALPPKTQGLLFDAAAVS